MVGCGSVPPPPTLPQPDALAGITVFACARHAVWWVGAIARATAVCPAVTRRVPVSSVAYTTLGASNHTVPIIHLPSHVFDLDTYMHKYIYKHIMNTGKYIMINTYTHTLTQTCTDASLADAHRRVPLGATSLQAREIQFRYFVLTHI